MSEFRINPADICMSDAMPWQQHWEARTTLPLEAVVNEDFFLPMRDTLRAGDQISLCRYDARDPTHRSVKLLELVTLRVLEAGREAKAIPLAIVGSIIKVEAAKPKPQVKAA